MVCKSCNNKIPSNIDICPECGAFIRSRVNNLEIWKTMINLFAEPKNTLEQIVYAKRKSGILFLFFILTLIFSFFNFLAINYLASESGGIISFFLTIEKTFSNSFISILAVLVLIRFLFMTFGYVSRSKDLLAVISYSFVPFIFSSIFLFPIEIGLFGEFWFTFHPFPWIIKPFPAYFLISIHGLMLLWSVMLLFLGMLKIFKFKIVSFSATILILFVIIFAQYLTVRGFSLF